MPLPIWESLLTRDDSQIGVTEAMAVSLALASFREELAGNVVSFFVDNSGALNGFIKGGSTSAEQHINQ